MSDENEEQRAEQERALRAELLFVQQRYPDEKGRVADIEAELARIGAGSRSGKKATRLKGEGRKA